MSHLYRFFLGLTRGAFGTLGLGGPAAAEYVAEVCSRFARADALYAVRGASGERLSDLVSLALAAATAGRRLEGVLHRHVGDFALFMSGLFHRYVAERGVLDLYYQQGAAAYRRAAGAEVPPSWPSPLLLQELAAQFEHYAGALDFMRQAYLATPPGCDPFRGLLARLDSLTGGQSEN